MDVWGCDGKEDTGVGWGEYHPSSETPLFVELYNQMPGTSAIIHGHCPRISYDIKMRKYATGDYIRCGLFGEGKGVLNKLLTNDGFAILKLHGEVACGSSLNDSYKKLKLKLGEAHEK